eukprot:TRINITY_DN38149_c0_g1_i1.p1 TRINITY_DN38149_c0_g1~~TRINITY_DN38149_c0_g1_i1.p1  ORF type:complete len:470 (-),score=67.57 TRINITY_DN38149_c0_g1_i1:192-1601(-)
MAAESKTTNGVDSTGFMADAGHRRPLPQLEVGVRQSLIVSPGSQRRARIAAQIAVAMPELGWSVSEALMMPLLLKLKAPDQFIALVWLVSPVVGSFLHPLIGSLSDRYGRRPFVVAFSALAAVGLAAVPRCASAFSGTTAQLVTCFAFGLTDLSHDILVTPTRAAMNDLFEPEVSEKRCAIAGGVGKLVALVIAVAAPSDTAFLAVAIVMAVASALQFTTGRASGVNCNLSDGRSNGTEEGESTPVSLAKTPQGFWMLWLCSCAGWLSINTYSFYFTSVWAEGSGAKRGSADFEYEVHIATQLLIANGVMFLVAGYLIAAVVSCLRGELAAVNFAQGLLAFALASFRLLPRLVAAGCVVLLVPMAYQIVANSPFAWLERQPGFDERQRGRLTGWMNSSLSVAQAITAVGSGPIVAAAGDHLVAALLFAASANVLCLVAFAAWCGITALRRRRNCTDGRHSPPVNGQQSC